MGKITIYPNENETNLIDAAFQTYIEELPYINNDMARKKEYLEFLYDNTFKITNSEKNFFLVKGQVQSGKTNNIIYIINEFFKSGGEFVYFVSGTTNDLDNQNMNRIRNAFKLSNANLIIHTQKLPSITDIQKDIDAKVKIIYYSIKNKRFLDFLSKLENSNIKMLIILDETDHTNISKNWEKYIYQAITSMPNAKFIYCTATPYQNLYSYQEMYEEYILFKANKGYQGLRELLPRYSTIPNNIFANKDELQKEINRLVIRYLVHSYKLNKSECLINVVHTNEEQSIIYKRVNDFMKNISKNNDLQNQVKNYISKLNASEEIFKSILKFSKYNLNSINLLNSKNSSTKKLNKRILIGSYLMNRGITFKDLISQIYVTKGDKSKYNPSSLMQSSRWFGYNRPEYLDIVITEDMNKAYNEILLIEKHLDTFTLKNNFKTWFDNMEFQYLIIKGNKHD